MKKAILVLFILLFTVLCLAFSWEFVSTRETVFIVPCFVGFVGVVLGIALLCKRQIECYVLDECLVIKYKDQVLHRFKKEDVYCLSFIYDVYDASLSMVHFRAKNKGYYIQINNKNREDVISFFENIEKRESDNLLYYLLSFIISIFR